MMKFMLQYFVVDVVDVVVDVVVVIVDVVDVAVVVVVVFSILIKIFHLNDKMKWCFSIRHQSLEKIQII